MSEYEDLEKTIDWTKHDKLASELWKLPSCNDATDATGEAAISHWIKYERLRTLREIARIRLDWERQRILNDVSAGRV